MAMKILFADDDPETLTMLSRVAKSRGHTVVTCEDGAEALGTALAERPDAIVLDLMMPRLDGRDVVSRLKKDPATSDTPIVILTAVDDDFSRSLCLEYGADDYVVKPTDLVALFQRLEYLADKTKPPRKNP